MSSLAIRSGFCRSLLPRFEAQLPRVSHALFARHVTEARHFATVIPPFFTTVVPLFSEPFRFKQSRDRFWIDRMQEWYGKEGCGICEKEGAEIFWYSPYSKCAHIACYEKIEEIEDPLDYKIHVLFKKSGDRDMAHRGVIDIVKKEIGDVSILSFLEKNDEESFKSILYSNKVVDFLTDKAVAATLKTLNKGAHV